MDGGGISGIAAHLALARGSTAMRLLLAAAYFVVAAFAFLVVAAGGVEAGDGPQAVRAVMVGHCEQAGGSVRLFFTVATVLWTAGGVVAWWRRDVSPVSFWRLLPFLAAAPGVFFLGRMVLTALAAGG